MSIGSESMEEYYESKVIPSLKGKIHIQSELIKLYQDFIEFIGLANAPALQVAVTHGYVWKQENVDEGERRRKEIKALLDELS